MNKKIALAYIDEWANFYMRLFGEADDLELIEKKAYTILKPKDNQWASIFDAQLEQLNDADLIKTVTEIKETKYHVWWNQYSDMVNAVVFPEGRHEPTSDDDEVYAVMTPDAQPEYREETPRVSKAATLDDYEIFYNICFDNILNANNFFSLHQKGKLCGYIAYDNEKPVSATALLKNGRIYSLEFTSTLPEYRRKGFAAAVCRAAIKDAFCEGAEVVTIRAGGGSSADNDSKHLGRKLGFKFIE